MKCLTSGTLTDALIVEVQCGASEAQDVISLNGPAPLYPRVGAIAGSPAAKDVILAPGERGFTYIAGVGYTPPNSVPSLSQGHSMMSPNGPFNGPAESTIWHVDCSTGSLTAQWTNPDGTQHPNLFYYDPDADYVGLTGDLNEYKYYYQANPFVVPALLPRPIEELVRGRLPMESVYADTCPFSHPLEDLVLVRCRFSESHPILKLTPSTNSTVKARASAVPISYAVGNIQVKRDGVPIGYIRKTFRSSTSKYFTHGALTDALAVEVQCGASGAQFILPLTRPDAQYPYVGAVAGPTSNLGPESSGYVYLSAVGYTPENSPPSVSAGNSMQSIYSNRPSEATIWHVDCATGAMTAQWTNPSGSQPPNVFFYDESEGFLGMTGDLNEVFLTYGGTSYVVTLHFVPSSPSP
ncbi:hypothetical protein MD484_g6542, partial [Candolleomyces efflorescens]